MSHLLNNFCTQTGLVDCFLDLVGACPGPIFILLGFGFLSVGIILIGALLGTFIYGVLKDKLPHYDFLYHCNLI